MTENSRMYNYEMCKEQKIEYKFETQKTGEINYGDNGNALIIWRKKIIINVKLQTEKDLKEFIVRILKWLVMCIK